MAMHEVHIMYGQRRRFPVRDSTKHPRKLENISFSVKFRFNLFSRRPKTINATTWNTDYALWLCGLWNGGAKVHLIANYAEISMWGMEQNMWVARRSQLYFPFISQFLKTTSNWGDTRHVWNVWLMSHSWQWAFAFQAKLFWSITDATYGWPKEPTFLWFNQSCSWSKLHKLIRIFRNVHRGTWSMKIGVFILFRLYSHGIYIVIASTYLALRKHDTDPNENKRAHCRLHDTWCTGHSKDQMRMSVGYKLREMKVNICSNVKWARIN